MKKGGGGGGNSGGSQSLNGGPPQQYMMMNGNSGVSQAGSTVGSRQGGASMNNTQTKKVGGNAGAGSIGTPQLTKQLSNNSNANNGVMNSV